MHLENITDNCASTRIISYKAFVSELISKGWKGIKLLLKGRESLEEYVSALYSIKTNQYEIWTETRLF